VERELVKTRTNLLNLKSLDEFHTSTAAPECAFAKGGRCDSRPIQDAQVITTLSCRTASHRGLVADTASAAGNNNRPARKVGYVIRTRRLLFRGCEYPSGSVLAGSFTETES
jgi:hypothetical protein